MKPAVVETAGKRTRVSAIWLAPRLSVCIHHQLGDIADLYFPVLSGNAVGHHRQTKRAGDGDCFCGGIESFGDPADTDAFGGRIVEPHAAAAGTATGCLAAVSGHFF